MLVIDNTNAMSAKLLESLIRRAGASSPALGQALKITAVLTSLVNATRDSKRAIALRLLDTNLSVGVNDDQWFLSALLKHDMDDITLKVRIRS